MKIQFLSEERVQNSDLAKGSIFAAERIWQNIKIDYVTEKHVAFSCHDSKFETNHSVIYFSERKFDKAWLCDCKWFSLKNKFCKHIIGVFYRLNRDKEFLGKLEKEKITSNDQEQCGK